MVLFFPHFPMVYAVYLLKPWSVGPESVRWGTCETKKEAVAFIRQEAEWKRLPVSKFKIVREKA